VQLAAIKMAWSVTWPKNNFAAREWPLLTPSSGGGATLKSHLGLLQSRLEMVLRTLAVAGRLGGPSGSLYTGSVFIVFAVVSLIFHKSVYQTYSQMTPHRDSGLGYVLIYFVAPLVLIAIGSVMVAGVFDGHCVLMC
jgi:hypothetical protein